MSKEEARRILERMDRLKEHLEQSIKNAATTFEEAEADAEYVFGQAYIEAETVKQLEGDKLLREACMADKFFSGSCKTFEDFVNRAASAVKLWGADWQRAVDAVSEGLTSDEFVARELERWRASFKGIDNR